MRDFVTYELGSIAEAYESVRSDEAYLDAVRRGDMESCSRMVSDAAEARGYRIHAFHGTELGFLGLKTPFHVFDDASHFGDRKVAEKVAEHRGVGGEQEPYVYDVFLRIDRPKRVPDVPEDWNDTHSEYWWRMLRLAVDGGYDGLVYANRYEGDGDSYVITSPNQVKSAEPVTYGDDGGVIPLSKRFDAANNDMRY